MNPFRQALHFSEEDLPVIELVDPINARAVRNKNNVLALYDLMINKKESDQTAATVRRISQAMTTTPVAKASADKTSKT